MRYVYVKRRTRRGRVMPERRPVFECPACDYEMEFRTVEEAGHGAVAHCRVSGRDHDRVRLDVMEDMSPLFAGRGL